MKNKLAVLFLVSSLIALAISAVGYSHEVVVLKQMIRDQGRIIQSQNAMLDRAEEIIIRYEPRVEKEKGVCPPVPVW